MNPFVLVHGAWHGSWCWRDVVPLLWQAGHPTYAVTLTGLGDRSHLLPLLKNTINLETHIEDVKNVIISHDLTDVILVVHSYAGMIGTAIADRLTNRLSQVIYLDAVLPQPGESWSSTHASATKSARLQAAEASPYFAFPAPDSAVFGLNPQQTQWVNQHMTPQPAACYTQPLNFDIGRVNRVDHAFINCNQPALATIDVSRARLKDPAFWEGSWVNARLSTLTTGHDPMVSEPQALARLLLDHVPRKEP